MTQVRTGSGRDFLWSPGRGRDITRGMVLNLPVTQLRMLPGEMRPDISVACVGLAKEDFPAGRVSEPWEGCRRACGLLGQGWERHGGSAELSSSLGRVWDLSSQRTGFRGGRTLSRQLRHERVQSVQGSHLRVNADTF